MKIVATAVVRNEADIIEAFLRHTAAYCDQLIVIDHGSTDETPEIMRKLAAEGLKLKVITDATLGHIQVSQMNRLLKLAVNEFEADWVVNLDADEFLQGDLLAAFSQAQGDPKCLKIWVRNYVVHPSDDPSVINPVERLTHWDKAEADHLIRPSSFKVMVPGAFARQEGAYLEQANHRFLIDGFEAPFEILSDVILGHFSLRSPAQYACRLMARSMQQHRKIDERADISLFYDEPYRQARECYSRFAANFTNTRLAYAHTRPEAEKLIDDPFVYRGTQLRYTPTDFGTDRFIKNILLMAEALARSITPQLDAFGQDRGFPASSIAFFPEGMAGKKFLQNIPKKGQLAFSFSLDAVAGNAPLCFGISSDRGIVEIAEFTLIFAEKEIPARTFEGKALQEMIEIAELGVRLTEGSGTRVLISRQPMVFLVNRWRKEGEQMPIQAVIKLRLVHEMDLVVGAISTPAIIGKLSRLANEVSASKEIKKSLQKEAKQARKELEDARSHPFKFLIRTWKAKLRGKRP